MVSTPAEQSLMPWPSHAPVCSQTFLGHLVHCTLSDFLKAKISKAFFPFGCSYFVVTTSYEDVIKWL